MTSITDEQMRESLTRTCAYCIVILTAGPNYTVDGVDKIIWEHGRRNFALRADGVLPLVFPVTDDSAVCGFGVFTVGPAEVATIMDADPGVLAGVFTYAVHPCRGFPGSVLPELREK